MVTAVYVLYFKNVVMSGQTGGESDRLWGLANAIGAAVVFFLAPLLGAAADIAGKKRLFQILFTLLCVGATATLSLTGQGTVTLAMTAFVIALVGFEAACVFNNAFLPELVPNEQMDALSGDAWALGYLGGLGCLLICLPLAMRESFIRFVPLVVALWFLVFSIPVFLLVRDRNRPVRSAFSFGAGWNRIATTVREIGNHRDLARFLLAFFFFNNAVSTIIVFAVAFSADSLLFSTGENIALVIVMNVVAAPGASVFGRIAGRIGARRTIIATLFMWLGVVAGAEMAAWPGLFTASGAKLWFWGVAVLASLCIGAIQSTSRTFVGQLAPEGRSGEFFGFMAFAGRGSAILGPLVFGMASDAFSSQRVAVLTIGLFFAVGLFLMRFVSRR